jgi:GNAT superfamily N-acetyltransferase
MDDEVIGLREATIEDIDSIVDFIKAMLHELVSYGEHAPNEESQIDSHLRTRFTTGLEKEDRTVLIAALEGAEEPVGIIEASVTDLHEIFRPKSVLHIHSIYVEHNHRGEGIGRRLLEAALEWGKGMGCVEAELNVLVGNPARRLYESAGFEAFEVKMRLEL